METIHGVVGPLKKLQRLTVAVTFGALALFSQLSLAAPYSEVVELGVLRGGNFMSLEGATPKADAYMFSLAMDGKILINVATVDFDRQVHQITLWDESGSGKQLAKGADIRELDLTADTLYKLVVSGGNRAYNATIAVAQRAPEVPLPASVVLFGSAVLGLVLGKKHLRRT
jgi:hypothetical protein